MTGPMKLNLREVHCKNHEGIDFILRCLERWAQSRHHVPARRRLEAQLALEDFREAFDIRRKA